MNSNKKEMPILVGSFEYKDNQISTTCKGPAGTFACYTESGGEKDVSELLLKRHATQMAALATGLIHININDKQAYAVGIALAFFAADPVYEIEICRNGHVFIARPRRKEKAEKKAVAPKAAKKLPVSKEEVKA